MTTCPTCHGKDGMHGLDCGFTSGRPHMTHHNDCGCRSAEHERRIAELGSDLAHAESERMEAEESWCVQRDRAVTAEAALAERDRESTDLLDAIFQTVDPEDGEEIVAEAFPGGGPAWVLAWYQEHPNEEEFRARAEREAK